MGCRTVTHANNTLRLGGLNVILDIYAFVPAPATGSCGDKQESNAAQHGKT
jgi:hypothetical protein